MSKTGPELDIVEGSGNVFRDVGLRDPDTKLIKADLAAEIIRVLRTAKLSNVSAAQRAGVAETDISRIRHADLNRFTIDRLVRILNRIDRRVEVVIMEEPRRAHA
jgi:predicted XRE-type DNA-binding protein